MRLIFGLLTTTRARRDEYKGVHEFNVIRTASPYERRCSYDPLVTNCKLDLEEIIRLILRVECAYLDDARFVGSRRYAVAFVLGGRQGRLKLERKFFIIVLTKTRCYV